MTEQTIDFNARYSVAGMSGVAFWLRGYAIERPAGEYYDDEIGEYCYDDEPAYDTSMVRAVMVGDDREHIIDVDDLTPLDELDYCSSCGQIGCGHDGRERE